ncbi:MAG: hypothetical protein PHQ52_02195 [Candidatus Omnitrophica bacterium]|nr:hypothetical protein [Candidatus Omnitrophota bacterium]
MKYKKYKKPVITGIKLNSENAILQVCQVGGIYIEGTNHCKGTGHDIGICSVSVKGHIVSGGNRTHTVENAPS